MNIILSTRNPSKAQQIAALFAGSSISLVTLDQAGIVGQAVEDGQTLRENALKKIQFAHQHAKSPSWTMSDDTGLFIKALDGRPGVHAATWAGSEATTDEIMRHTLSQLVGVTDRSAFFETVVAIMSPKGEVSYFSGKVNGSLLDNPRVPPQPKMPYSPLFVPEGTEKVWAQMSVEAENLISHRGKAFRAARAWLETQQ